MRKRHWSLILAATIALGGLAVACGDDDNNPANPVDGGRGDVVVPPDPDGGPKPDGGPPPDGGCTFATYVIGLINTQTTATAKPDTTLGAGCADTTTQAEFKPLFP